MPSLTLDLRGTCTLCGTRIRGIGVQGFRINRRSIVATRDRGLFWTEPRCHECGWETHSVPQVLALSAEARETVATTRARRWPDA